MASKKVMAIVESAQEVSRLHRKLRAIGVALHVENNGEYTEEDYGICFDRLEEALDAQVERVDEYEGSEAR